MANNRNKSSKTVAKSKTSTPFKMPTGRRVPVSERAVFQRVQRALAKQGRQIKKHRGADCDDYMLIDTHHNYCVDEHCYLEPLARELGIIESWEEIGERTALITIPSLDVVDDPGKLFRERKPKNR